MKYSAVTKSLLPVIVIAILIKGSLVFSTVLPVPERFQEQNEWCWAGATQAIFAYYQTTLTQTQIAQYGTNGYNTWNYLYGTDSESPYYRSGINWILYNWGLGSAYGDYVISQTNVGNQIDSGRPFVIRWGWYSGGGHFVDGRGLEGNYLYYMDPWPGNGHQIALYSWVVGDGIHEWTHSLEVTTYPTFNTYTVSYNANNATSGSVPTSQTKTHNVSLTLRTNTGNLAKTGYTFAGWNTNASGTGTNYPAGGTYTANASVVLYARYTPNIYTVNYNANNATSGSVPTSQIKLHNVSLILRTNTGNLARTGYTFAGWNTNASGTGTNYPVGGTYTANVSDVLYAKWTPITYAISYNANNCTSGSVPASQIKLHNVSLILRTNTGNLARTGYDFTGWNTNASGTGTNYPAGGTYAANASDILYAEWTRSCPSCSGDDIVIKNYTYPPDSRCNCTAQTITVGPNVTVQNGAEVIFDAQTLIFVPDVNIEQGATLQTSP